MVAFSLPSPTSRQSCSLFLPSVHDGVELECRIRYPEKRTPASHRRQHPQARDKEGDGRDIAVVNAASSALLAEGQSCVADGEAGEAAAGEAAADAGIKAAVIAHPYAPLGGCFDDPVVNYLSDEILRQGFVVGTFNFRGAGGSGGRTSWTARAEVDDYISFVGFFVHYLHASGAARAKAAAADGLDDDERKQSDQSDFLSPLQTSTGPPATAGARLTSGRRDAPIITLVLGGYSYGSLITTLLPPMRDILRRFHDPPAGSVEQEIVAYARVRGSADDGGSGHRHSLSGLGYSDSHRRPRLSIDVDGEEAAGRLSTGSFRRSVDRVRTLVDLRRRSSEVHKDDKKDDREGAAAPITETGASASAATGPVVKIHYLLVSPLLPPVSSLATLFRRIDHSLDASSPSLDAGASIDDHSSSSSSSSSSNTSVNHKLVANPTLAVYGGQDGFTARRKLHKWARMLASYQPGSRFAFCEVPNAGHFWHEDGAEQRLREAVREWLTRVVLGDP